MKYIVYQTTNKINGKLYVGVHKTINPNVFDNYVGNGIKIGYSLENPKTVYQHALKKYGYDNFVRTTLFVYDTLEEAYAKEGEIVNADFVKNDNNYNTSIGGIIAPIIFKSVYQFNNKYELVKVWNEGQLEICEYLGISQNKISYALTHKKILQECIWSYDENPDFSEYTKYRNYNLYQYDFYGNLLNIYKSTKDCSEKTGYSFTSLQDATSHKKKFKESFWTHNPDEIFNIIKMIKLYNRKYIQVYKLSETNDIISEYIDINSAAKELKIEQKELRNIIKSNKLYNGYYYSFSNNIKTSTKVGQYNKDTNELIKIWNSVSECAKIHPKCREVLKGQRNHTHGYTFKYLTE